MKDKYPESKLTEKIIGCAFEVFKELGYGLAEKSYQSALAQEFQERNLQYSKEKYGNIIFKGKKIYKYYLDFLVENKVAVELKVRNEIYQKDVNQLLNYIRSEKIKLGLLIIFTKNGARVKRLIN